MDEFQFKFLKIHSQFNLLDSRRQRDMVAIGQFMDMILDLFSKEIAWDNLNVTGTETAANSQMQLLQKLAKQVQRITVESNLEANKMDKVSLR